VICLLRFTVLCCTGLWSEYIMCTLQDNLQILRDLSLLQIQMRDLDGYRVSTQYSISNMHHAIVLFEFISLIFGLVSLI